MRKDKGGKGEEEGRGELGKRGKELKETLEKREKEERKNNIVIKGLKVERDKLKKAVNEMMKEMG